MENQNIVKKQAGVTLLALVITIAVLAILAGISITMITGDEGLVNNAKKVAEDAEKAKDKTSQDLKDLVDELGEVAGWIQKEDGSIKKGKTIVHIGDYVNYDCTTYKGSYSAVLKNTGIKQDQIFKAEDYKYKWRVLGVDDKNQLLLFPENNVEPSEGGNTVNDRKWFVCRSNKIYCVIKELDNISDIYGHGKGATGARSVNEDDINKITGYDITKFNNYGKQTTFMWDETNGYRYTENGVTKEVPNAIFYYFKDDQYQEILNEVYDTEGNLLKESISVTITNNSYKYTPDKSKIGEAAYNMLFEDKLSTSQTNMITAAGYWTASIKNSCYGYGFAAWDPVFVYNIGKTKSCQRISSNTVNQFRK